MANGGGRFTTIIKAKLNNLMNRMEDPEEQLDYAYQKQLDLLQGVKRGVADVVTAKKRLEIQREKLEKQMIKLDQQARDAVSIGNEDLARLALERKRFVQAELEGMDQQVAELATQQDSLVQKQEDLRNRIEQFKVKKEVVKAQYAAASAQVNIASVTKGIGGSMDGVALSLERASEKIENMKARAAATEELEATGAFDDVLALGSGQDDIDRQLAQNKGNSVIDAELDKIRAELALEAPKSAPKQIEADKKETPAAE